MSLVRIVLLAAALALTDVPVRAQDSIGSQQNQAAEAAGEKCEHGVKTSICARCNPKLEAVFKAKNDWCGEHSRPESQCAICHPELAKQGVK